MQLEIRNIIRIVSVEDAVSHFDIILTVYSFSYGKIMGRVVAVGPLRTTVQKASQ